MKKTFAIVSMLVLLSACSPKSGDIQPTPTSDRGTFIPTIPTITIPASPTTLFDSERVTLEPNLTATVSSSTPAFSVTSFPGIALDGHGVDIEPIRTHKTIAVSPLELPSSAWTLYQTGDAWIKSLLSIAVEPSGVLWFGTIVSGIVRFDGETWTRYTTEDGLVDNAIRDLILTPEGHLWVRTASGEVSFFDGETWTTYTTEDVFLENVLSMELAPDGTLWVATPNRGLLYFDGKTWRQATMPDAWCPRVIYNIVIPSDGSLWLGGVDCVSHFEGDQWSFYMFHGWTYVSDMLVSPDGIPWFGHGDTVTGFATLKEDELVYYHGAEGDARIGGVTALAIDREGGIWMGGCCDDGIIYFDGEEAWTTLTPFDIVKVFDIATTDDGIVWITSDKGLIRYLPSE